MSLINKMLQDLDSRGTPAGAGLDAQVQSVARAREASGARAIALAVAGIAVVGAAGWFGWMHFHRMPLPAAAPAVAPVSAKPAPGSAAKLAALQAAITAAKPSMQAAQPAATRDETGDHAGAKTVAPMEPDSEEARATRRALAQLLASRAPVALPYDARADVRAEARTQADAPANARAYAEARTLADAPAPLEARPPARTRAAAPARTRAAALADVPPRAGGHVPKHAAAAASDSNADGAVRQTGAAQRAENAYRRALADLQEGRMGETVDALEQALKEDPNHEAARQTLVGLLVEAKRTDEAMRQLQLGLTLDPRQPAMAMLLARLQIEGGGNGIDTLTRTLPYAGNDPDYHGFLAGALARQQRNREAAEQYQLAVRAAPANGVWWMGLGLALQADKRNAEALDAFQKARAAGNLSADLQAFIERRVQQLSH